MSKRNRKSLNVANANVSNNVVTLSHDATNNDATREQSTFTNNVASTQTTFVAHNTNVVRHAKNDRMTNEQIDECIDKLLYELYTLQHDDENKHRNEQKRVRRALRSYNYFISKTNVVEHEQRVKRVIEKFANVAKQ